MEYLVSSLVKKETINYNKKNDTQRIYEDEDNSLEAPQEEIKIEINRELEKKNNDININRNEIEINNNEENSNSYNNNYTTHNNKIEELTKKGLSSFSVNFLSSSRKL